MIMSNTLKFLLIIFLTIFLNNCSSVNNLNNSIKSISNLQNQNCASNPKLCNNQDLCNEAVLGGKWQTRASYIPFVQEAWKRGLSCGVQYSSKNSQMKKNQKNIKDCHDDPSVCSNIELCEKATLNDKWETRSYYQDHVSLAKKRNLNCNVKVNKRKNNIDKMMQYALRRLIKLNILSNDEYKNKEKIIKNMNVTDFDTLYKFCKDSFAKSEPGKCDNAIKNLN